MFSLVAYSKQQHVPVLGIYEKRKPCLSSHNQASQNYLGNNFKSHMCLKYIYGNILLVCLNQWYMSRHQLQFLLMACLATREKRKLFIFHFYRKKK